MFLFPGIVKTTVLYSLKVCANSLIPSLFPFIISTRLLFLFLSHTKKKMSNKIIFAGLSSTALYAFATGIISGFPTGAIISGQLYKNGNITKTEAEKVAVYSSVASPAFCLNFLGYEILNSRIYGFFIYLACVVSSLLLLAVSSFISDKNSIPDTTNITQGNSTVAEIITDSSITMLSICAFVTYFMCIGNVLIKSISFVFSSTRFIEPYILGILEMTSGIAILADFDFSKRLLTASVITGFGGISAMMQVWGICHKNRLMCKSIIAVKAVSLILTPLATFLIILFFNLTQTPLKINSDVVIKILALMSVIGISLFIYSKKRKKPRNAK